MAPVVRVGSTRLGTVAHDRARFDEAVDAAREALEAGRCIVVPTDTVYGVAAHLERPQAIDRLFELKGRGRSQAMAVLVADAHQAWSLVDLDAIDPPVRAEVVNLVDGAWPGALTIVGPRRASFRYVDLGGDPTTIGVRVPEEPMVRALAGLVGPIVTTSANRSGQPTPVDAEVAAHSLRGEVALVVDGGACRGLASTVLDITTVPFRVLRRGGFDPVASGLEPALVEGCESNLPGLGDRDG